MFGDTQTSLLFNGVKDVKSCKEINTWQPDQQLWFLVTQLLRSLLVSFRNLLPLYKYHETKICRYVDVDVLIKTI